MTGPNKPTDLLAGELKKAFGGRTWVAIGLVGLLLALTSVAGWASEAGASAEAGVPMSTITAETIRFWFMAMLSSMVFGAVFVTREYANGSIARSVLLSGSRSRLFAAKLGVVTVMGLVYALVVAVLMVASAWLIVPLSGHSAVWTGESTRTVLGVFAVIVAAGPWGALFGWIIRNQGAAIALLLVSTLVVDEGIFRLVPAVGKYTMQISMGSVFLDVEAEALPVPAAAAVIVAWLLVAGVLAHVLLRRRDVL